MTRCQNRGGGIMIQAGFSEKEKTNIAFLSLNQNSSKYINALEKTLLPFARKNHANKYIFQQNNASIHRSRFTKDWLLARNIPLMTWPVHSLDLNPIENLWARLARRVYANGRQFSFLSELKTSVSLEWNNISLEECYNLMRSIKRQCARVLERGGRHTGYQDGLGLTNCHYSTNLYSWFHTCFTPCGSRFSVKVEKI